MLRSPLPALLLAAVAAGCGGTQEALRRLDALHDPRDFSHRPDLPATCDACLEEVAGLGAARYGGTRDAARAVLLLSRVATEDSASLHRLEACRALARIGGVLAAAEDPPAGVPPTEGGTAAALGGIEGAAPGEERDALVRAVGGFRIPLPGDPGAAGLGREIRVLRGFLRGVLAVPDLGPEGDRALANLGGQVVRFSLAGALLHDGDPRVRGEAARAVAASGGTAFAEILRTAFAREPDAAARRAVVAAAGALAGRAEGAARDPVLAVLVAALDDDDRGVRFGAREALGTLAGEDLGSAPAPWIRWWDGTRTAP